MTRQQCPVLRDDVMEMMPDGDDGMVKGKGKGKKEKEREMDPLCKITHVGFPVGSGMQAFEILTIKKCSGQMFLMSCSRRVQILYRADAFLIG